jgi:hypothetical protein
MRIGPLWIHRRYQWDLEVAPIVCFHWGSRNATTRLLCIGWRTGRRLTISG